MSNEIVIRTQKHLSKGGRYGREFNRVRYNDELDWKTEQAYALEILESNQRLQKCTPESIGRSLIDLSVMGLTLSPAMRLAYLIPYGNTCTASPSYMGLEQVAYRTGMIEGIQCNVVRENDTFKVFTDRNGRNIQHEEAGNRGEVTHAYCIAWLTSGRTIIEVMDKQALRGCRDAAAKKNNGKIPFTWTGPFREEMYKKAALRRAWKHFPKVTNPQLVAMMEAVDRTDPMEFEDTPVNELPTTVGKEQIAELVAVFHEYDITSDQWINRQLKGLAAGMGLPNGNIHSLPVDRFDEAVELLRKGLDRWQTSTQSEPSDSAQDDTTAQRGAA
jgi:phage RecT family recombinase